MQQVGAKSLANAQPVDPRYLPVPLSRSGRRALVKAGHVWVLHRQLIVRAIGALVALMFVGQIVFMLGGMTVAVRNRFSIPTVGRDSMIGELGEARTELNPDGVVTVRGAPWRARTYRGRPVPPGGAVRVVAVDRLVLEVEPGDTPAEV